MSRSKRKTPVFTICVCHSQKEEKRNANRTLRRKVKQFLKAGRQILPKLREVSNVWDWKGDGKVFCNDPEEKWMRK